MPRISRMAQRYEEIKTRLHALPVGLSRMSVMLREDGEDGFVLYFHSTGMEIKFDTKQAGDLKAWLTNNLF